MIRDTVRIKKLIEAYQRGWKMTPEGDLIGFRGRLRKPAVKAGYLYVRYQSTRLYLHQLQAYQKFGEAALAPGVRVRHLDGNKLNNAWDNIEIKPADKPLKLAKVPKDKRRAVPPKLTADERVSLAYKKGYRVNDLGEVISPAGVIRKLQSNRMGRLTFTFGIGGCTSKTVTVHRLAAYQKYGESMFAPGIVVRHLDGNHLNNCPNNIILGTQKDNQQDLSSEARSARIAKGKPKLFEMMEKAKEIRRRASAGEDTRLLAKEYGVAHGTILGIRDGTKYTRYL